MPQRPWQERRAAIGQDVLDQFAELSPILGDRLAGQAAAVGSRLARLETASIR